jgi:hypothetical protein
MEDTEETKLICVCCGSLVKHQNLHTYGEALCCCCLEVNDKIKCACEREADDTKETIQSNKRCIIKTYNQPEYTIRIQGEEQMETPITNEDLLNDNLKMKEELKKMKKLIASITEQMGILRYADSE